MKQIKHLLRAVLLWARIWDICWWHNTEEYYLNGKDLYIDCKTAWEVSRGIWLED